MNQVSQGSVDRMQVRYETNHYCGNLLGTLYIIFYQKSELADFYVIQPKHFGLLFTKTRVLGFSQNMASEFHMGVQRHYLGEIEICAQLHTKSIFPILHILKFNRMMPFCNLFMKRPSYL